MFTVFGLAVTLILVAAKILFDLFSFFVLRPLTDLAYRTSKLVVYGGTVLGVLGLLAYSGMFDARLPWLRCVLVSSLPVSGLLQTGVNKALVFLGGWVSFPSGLASVIFDIAVAYFFMVFGFFLFGFVFNFELMAVLIAVSLIACKKFDIWL